MILRIELHEETTDWTISRLLIDGRFACWTLEDEARAKKVPGETRIPAGRYRVVLRTDGGFHERYLKRFGPDFHRGMLHITGVPGFDFILIHIGNTDEDTRGCVLVGERMTPGALQGSERAYRQHYPKVAAALLKGEGVWVDVAR